MKPYRIRIGVAFGAETSYQNSVFMNLPDQGKVSCGSFMPIGFGGSTREKHEYDVLELEDAGCRLVLHNDEVNTFGHVIVCLMKYCEHTAEQAEQCAWIVHLKGKCYVKSGSYEELVPVHTALSDQGLHVTIES